MATHRHLERVPRVFIHHYNATGRTARSISRRPIRSSQPSDLSGRRDQSLSSVEVGSADLSTKTASLHEEPDFCTHTPG